MLWPFIASHIGLTILWAAIVAIAIQFFINMEVERYTLATGETAITGFTRLWKPWWFLFIIMAVVPNMWPGFATGAATCLSFVVGDLNIQLVGILGLIAVGITLTASPVVYQTVERLQTVVIGAVIIWLGSPSSSARPATPGATSSAASGASARSRRARLAYSTVFGKDTGEDFDFIKAEGDVLSDTVAPWFATVFWLAGFFKLLSTMLGNFDYVSRITADAVKINATPDSTTWTESRIYAATVWALILFGVAILLIFTDQPLVLLVIGSALSAMVMFIYSILLIVLNRKALPAVIRISGYRLVILGVAVIWFGYFSARVLIAYIPQLWGG